MGILKKKELASRRSCSAQHNFEFEMANVPLIFLSFTLALCLGVSSDEDNKCILLALTEQDVDMFWINSAGSGADLQLYNDLQLYKVPSNATIVSFFISCVFHSNCSCEVIGVVGELDSMTASIIHGLANRSNLSITLVASYAPSDSLPVSNLDLPNVLDMAPLENYVGALVDFMDQLNWTRIGLISDSANYHLFAAEMLQKKLLLNPERNIAPYVRITESDVSNYLRQFEEYGTQIIVFLVNQELEF